MSEPSGPAHARLEQAEGVVTVTFTRDEKRNAVSAPMLEMIEQAVTALETRDDARVMVIRAEGRHFTAGIDVGMIRGYVREWADSRARGSNMRRDYQRLACHDLFDRIEAVEKPVVLAAHAPCVGVGVELGVSCDFRLAAASATFALPEIANQGFIPGSGGISRLTRLVGPHWAKWIVMNGETITADDAVAIGLVHDVWPDDEFDDKVIAFAHRLAAMSQEALGIAKVAIDAAVQADRRTARQLDRMAQTLVLTSPDFRDRLSSPPAS